MRVRSSFQTHVMLAFGMAMLVVLGMCAITWRLAAETAEAVRQADHTQDLLTALSQARSATLQAELSTQSYRVSGEERHLAERDAATARRERLLQRIRKLIDKDTAQQARWTALRAVIDERIALSRQIEDVRRREGQAAAERLVAKAPLQETRTRTHRLLDEMEADESTKLEQRNADWEHNAERMRRVGVLATLLLAAQLAGTALLVRRQWRETDRSRRQLEDSEERLAITLRSIGEAVMAADNEGRITRMNPVAERLTGWPASEATGRHAGEVVRLVDESGAALPANPIEQTLADGGAQSHEHGLALLARDGARCPVAFSATPKCDMQGRRRGTVMVLRDVTLERQAQRSIEAQNEWLAERVQERTAQLRESEAHLRSVTSHVPALIAYVDAEQRYVYANRPYIERFAAGREDITGSTVAEVLGEARYAIAAPLISRALRASRRPMTGNPSPASGRSSTTCRNATPRNAWWATTCWAPISPSASGPKPASAASMSSSGSASRISSASAGRCAPSARATAPCCEPATRRSCCMACARPSSRPAAIDWA